MKRISRTAMLALCLGVLSSIVSGSASAQQEPTIPTYPSPAFVSYSVPKGDWGPMTDGLQLRATTPKSQYQIQDQIIVDIDGKYSTTNDLLSETGGTDREFAVDVRDAEGHSISRTRYGSTIPSPNGVMGSVFRDRSLVLASNQMAEWHFWVNRMFDLTEPGIYTVTFTRFIPRDDGTIGKAVSNTLQIKVVDDIPSYEGVSLNSPERKTAD